MSDEYFVLMKDKASPYCSISHNGILALEPDIKLPIRSSQFSFPYKVKDISSDELFWNFNKPEPLLFDYCQEKGHVVSAEIMAILDSLRLAPHFKKRLTVYMQGKKTDHDYFYIAFEQGEWLKGVQQDPQFIFYDEENSDYQLDREGDILPTGHIALTAVAAQYDVFEFTNCNFLFDYIVLNAEAKAKLEQQGVKAGKFVPLQEAFNTVVTDRRLKLSDLLPKVKKTIKPWFADVSKKS
ncbi:Imm43 family immunity protein [Shewanella sp. WPAGA9]|uniref:Imm43 family immunity protein n=1 Tax=Shewanella sp. ENK2 TaxID=2775245 RepID=UPI0017877877|nr:Imm43 family immunity protein [Shewanella sp. WPAGA9]